MKLTSVLEVGFDAVSVDTIPLGADVVYFYPYTYEAVCARFPNAVKLGITPNGAHGLAPNGDFWRMADMEAGDLTEQEVAQWCAVEIDSGRPPWNPPTPYLAAENGPKVIAALAALGLTMGSPEVPWGMAWWNDVADLATPPGWHLPAPVYHQYYRQGQFTYDMSVALSSWVYPAPPTPPRAKYPTEDFMFIRNPGPAAIVTPNGTAAKGAICLCSAAGAVNLGNDWATVVADYAALNTPLVVHDLPATLLACMRVKYAPYTPAPAVADPEPLATPERVGEEPTSS